MEVSTPPSDVWSNGTRCWTRNRGRHRERDKPAYIDPLGLRAWYMNGELHRDGDKPALIDGDGSMAWYKHGRFQRSFDSTGAKQEGWHKAQTQITHFRDNSLRYLFVLNVCAM